MKKPSTVSQACWRITTHLVVCLFSVVASIWLAYLLRFDFQIPRTRIDGALWFTAIAVPAQIPVLWAMGWRRIGWSGISLPDLRFLLGSVFVAAAASTAAIAIVPASQIPRSIYLLQAAILLLLAIASRILARLHREAAIARRATVSRKPVLIYGAGLAGQALLRELRQNPVLGYEPVGFVDDAEALRSSVVQGLRVVSDGPGLCSAAARLPVEEILVAIPSASPATLNQVRTWCDQAGRPCKTVPGLGELLRQPGRLTDFRQISSEELLGRRQVQLDERAIRQMVAGKVMLVTGAAGSIGSELCRQLTAFNPSEIVAVDFAETPLFELENHMREAYPAVPFTPVLLDIRSNQDLASLMKQRGVDCVLHAAAYKHVPMMERHPEMAVSNNVLGTMSAVSAAETAGVSHFVMISTDKAVRPSSVMGATKRIAEMIVKSRNCASTTFVSVRFGNVLGSNGSVVPIFKKQIGAGGPVTVTHPEMRRYFMTIPEASRLVLQAMAMGTANEIFVLNMGEPVLIDNLARNLIALSGFQPDRDIRVTYTGLRPGEKLFEELYLGDENLIRTVHDKILVLRGPALDRTVIDREVRNLVRAADDDPGRLVDCIRDLVPDYAAGTPARPGTAGMRLPRTSPTPQQGRGVGVADPDPFDAVEVA